MTHAPKEDTRQCDWDVQTYDFWLDMLEKEGNDPRSPKSGIAVCFSCANRDQVIWS